MIKQATIQKMFRQQLGINRERSNNEKTHNNRLLVTKTFNIRISSSTEVTYSSLRTKSIFVRARASIIFINSLRDSIHINITRKTSKEFR